MSGTESSGVVFGPAEDCVWDWDCEEERGFLFREASWTR